MTVSVIIPLFNCADFIKETLDSIVPSERVSEIIVVDDKSTDGSVAVVKELKDERIKLFRLPSNCGASYARNFGISKASGEFLAFADADDPWLDQKIELQLAALKNSNAKICVSSVLIIDEKGSSLKLHRNRIKFPEKVYIDILSHNLTMFTPTLLFERCILEEVLFDIEMNYWEDFKFLIELSKKHKCVCLTDPLVERRINSKSISNNVDPEKYLIDAFRLYTTNSDALRWAFLTKHLYYAIYVFLKLKMRNIVK